LFVPREAESIDMPRTIYTDKSRAKLVAAYGVTL
jgi:hypothetical protein